MPGFGAAAFVSFLFKNAAVIAAFWRLPLLFGNGEERLASASCRARASLVVVCQNKNARETGVNQGRFFSRKLTSSGDLPGNLPDCRFCRLHPVPTQHSGLIASRCFFSASALCIG